MFEASLSSERFVIPHAGRRENVPLLYRSVYLNQKLSAHGILLLIPVVVVVRVTAIEPRVLCNLCIINSWWFWFRTSVQFPFSARSATCVKIVRHGDVWNTTKTVSSTGVKSSSHYWPDRGVSTYYLKFFEYLQLVDIFIPKTFMIVWVIQLLDVVWSYFHTKILKLCDINWIKNLLQWINKTARLYLM